MSTLAEYLYGLRYNRKLYKFQLSQAKERISGAERAEAQFAQDLAFKRPHAVQSYAARGLSESSISTQGLSDFDATAARRQAALDANLSQAKQGLDLLKEHHRMEQRLRVFEGIKAGLNSISMVTGMLGGGQSANGAQQMGPEPWAQGPMYQDPQSSQGWGDEMNYRSNQNPNLQQDINWSGGQSGQDVSWGDYSYGGYGDYG